MDKWGYNYLVKQKTLWEKEKLFVTSIFSFSHNVFKSCRLLMLQNEYLWSKGLNILVLRNASNIYVIVLCRSKQYLFSFPPKNIHIPKLITIYFEKRRKPKKRKTWFAVTIEKTDSDSGIQKQIFSFHSRR